MMLGPKEDGSYRSGSIFMDTPPHASMDDLCALANNKRSWASHIRSTLPQLCRQKGRSTQRLLTTDEHTKLSNSAKPQPRPPTLRPVSPHSPNLNIPLIF